MSRPKDRNRVMCPWCGRSKMLFETREKAERFIEYNARDYANPTFRPRRAYWCDGCGGWHITHTNKIMKPRGYEEQ